MQVGVTRALYIVMTEEERQKAYAMRAQQIRTIGGIARGPGAERYHNPSNFADTNIADEDAALLGTPDEIIARLKRLEAGGVENVLLADATASKRSLRIFASEILPAFRQNAPLKRVAE
jgi:alkanesulfonate monooxygenase SsuD/methylene tetrahydromethanopterin reductase-like flavin-dependent oxidoreductase (luciferase family)